MVGSSSLLLAGTALICAALSEGVDLDRQWVRPRVLGEDQRYASDEHVARPHQHHQHHRRPAHYADEHRFREVRSDRGPVGREARDESEDDSRSHREDSYRRAGRSVDGPRSRGERKFRFRQSSGSATAIGRKTKHTYQDSSQWSNEGNIISRSDFACVFCQYGLEQIVTNVLLGAQRGFPTLASLPGYMENHGQMAASIFPGPIPGAGNMPLLGTAGPWAPPAISFGGAPGAPGGPIGDPMSAGIFLETGSNVLGSKSRRQQRRGAPPAANRTLPSAVGKTATSGVSMLEVRASYGPRDMYAYRPRQARYSSGIPRYYAQNAQRLLYKTVYSTLENMCNDRMPNPFFKICGEMTRQYRHISELLPSNRADEICMKIKLCDANSYIKNSPHAVTLDLE